MFNVLFITPKTSHIVLSIIKDYISYCFILFYKNNSIFNDTKKLFWTI